MLYLEVDGVVYAAPMSYGAGQWSTSFAFPDQPGVVDISIVVRRGREAACLRRRRVVLC